MKSLPQGANHLLLLPAFGELIRIRCKGSGVAAADCKSEIVHCDIRRQFRFAARKASSLLPCREANGGRCRANARRRGPFGGQKRPPPAASAATSRSRSRSQGRSEPRNVRKLSASGPFSLAPTGRGAAGDRLQELLMEVRLDIALHRRPRRFRPASSRHRMASRPKRSPAARSSAECRGGTR